MKQTLIPPRSQARLGDGSGAAERSPGKRSMVPVGLATSAGCSNPGNLSNLEFLMCLRSCSSSDWRGEGAEQSEEQQQPCSAWLELGCGGWRGLRLGAGGSGCWPVSLPQGYSQVQEEGGMGLCCAGQGIHDAFEVEKNPNLKKSKGMRNTDLVLAAGKGMGL